MKNIFITPRSVGLSAAFLLVSGLSMLNMVGAANASNMLDVCRANTRNKVISCCDSYIEKKGRPFWMQEVRGTSCKSLVVCVAKKSKPPLCVLVPPPPPPPPPPPRIPS